MIPVVLAKLWSVIPRLFAWPPARSVAQVLERVTLLMLVGGILFEIVTGVLNIQYDYIFGFSFYTAHYFGAWVFIAGLCPMLFEAAHHGARPAVAVDAQRAAHLAAPTRCPNRPTPTGWSHPTPDPPTLSRRGALAVVGRRRAAGRGAHRRADPGRVHPQCGPVAAPGTQLRQGTQRLSDQPHRRRGRHRPRPTPARSGACTCAAVPNRCCWTAPRSTRCHTTPSNCRSPASKGGRPPRPGPVSGWPIWPPPPGCPTRLGGGVLTGALRRLQPCGPADQPDPQPRLAVGVSGQRRRPVAGSRLSGADHRARAARCAQHQMGVRPSNSGAPECAHWPRWRRLVRRADVSSHVAGRAGAGRLRRIRCSACATCSTPPCGGNPLRSGSRWP